MSAKLSLLKLDWSRLYRPDFRFGPLNLPRNAWTHWSRAPRDRVATPAAAAD